MFWYFTLRSVTELSPSAWSLHDLCWCSMWYLHPRDWAFLVTPSMWSLCTSVTVACFLGGLWVLPQCNRESVSWWNVAPSSAWPSFVSLHFLGGLWVLQQGRKTYSLVIPWEVLLQHDYDLFYWVEFGSFTSVKVICFLVDCGCFTSMTVICFLEWIVGPSPTWPWSVFLVDYVSFSSMTMISFLGWTKLDNNDSLGIPRV